MRSIEELLHDGVVTIRGGQMQGRHVYVSRLEDELSPSAVVLKRVEELLRDGVVTLHGGQMQGRPTAVVRLKNELSLRAIVLERGGGRCGARRPRGGCRGSGRPEDVGCDRCPEEAWASRPLEEALSSTRGDDSSTKSGREASGQAGSGNAARTV